MSYGLDSLWSPGAGLWEAFRNGKQSLHVSPKEYLAAQFRASSAGLTSWKCEGQGDTEKDTISHQRGSELQLEVDLMADPAAFLLHKGFAFSHPNSVSFPSLGPW